MRSCPYCEAEIDSSVQTCLHCNVDLTKPIHTGPVRVRGDREATEHQPYPLHEKLAVAALLMLLGIGILVALLLSRVQRAHSNEYVSRCKVNLKQIAIALHNYHDVYGSFPPAYIADEQGKPMHSWRVLVLPFLDAQEMYNAYDFSQPWDSPANSWLLDEMPEVFACPLDSTGKGSGTTSYAAVFGPNCVFRGSEPIGMRDIVDGTSNTFLVGETAGAEIPWTKPEDIDVTKHPTLGDPNGFSSEHEGGVYFLLGDGAVRFISIEIDADLLNRLYERRVAGCKR